MEIQTLAIDYVLDLPIVQTWPELMGLLKRGALPNVDVWKTPVLACEAVGGKPEQAVPASAALACLQISLILIDDLLDADPRGEYHTIGAPATANLASALQAVGLEAIMQSEVDQAVKSAALDSLNQMMLITAWGQYLDVQHCADEDAYWRLVQTKSSPFFGVALQVGALYGGAGLETAESLRQIGCLYGEILQIHDDLHDTMAVPANSDWVQGRSPLPILFAQIVEHPDRARFLKLCQSVSNPEALAEAQTILIRCGAISYCVDQLVRRHQRAIEMLRSMTLVHRDGLEALLEPQIKPVRELFRAVGMAQPNGERRKASAFCFLSR